MKRLTLTEGKMIINTGNHTFTQEDYENRKEFILSTGIGCIYSVPKEVKAMNQALVRLDEKLGEIGFTDTLKIKAVGGYAIHGITANSTDDIDTIVRLNERVVSAVAMVAAESKQPMDPEWLNDKVLQCKSFDDRMFLKVISKLQADDTWFEPVKDNLPSFEHIVFLKAKPEPIAVLKICAINGRQKEKDRDDLLKVCQAMKWGAKELWNILDTFGVQNLIEKTEFANLLYTVGVITDEADYVEFIG